MFEEFATVCLLVMGFLGVGEVGGFILLARIFCCKTVLFLPFRVSFYRQQRSRIKECFGIKDCQAQFIHIRIKRFWRRRSRHFNFANGMKTSGLSHLKNDRICFSFFPLRLFFLFCFVITFFSKVTHIFALPVTHPLQFPFPFSFYLFSWLFLPSMHVFFVWMLSCSCIHQDSNFFYY